MHLGLTIDRSTLIANRDQCDLRASNNSVLKPIRSSKRARSLSSVFCARAQVWELTLVEVRTLEFSLAAALLASLVYSLRPHGWCDAELIEVAESTVHQRGVFAKRDIPGGTVLGAYPGHARTPSEMADKVGKHPQAKAYVFNTDSGWFLDPTDGQGYPKEGKLWGIIPTTLAFVNEPPPGSFTNMTIEDGGSNFAILFVTTQQIQAGEELFIDYGVKYDRNGY